MKIRYAVLAALALSGLGACSASKPTATATPTPTPAVASASATAAPSPILTKHAVNDLFRVGPWQLRITGVDRDQADNTLGEVQNVDVIKVTYINASNGPAEFKAADVNGAGTLGIVYATDAEGAHYELRNTIANGTVNKNVSGHNYFVFQVAPGTRLTTLVIGGTDEVDLA